MVDEEDNVIGPITKLEGHFLKDGKPLQHPHRAFSLFLFNQKNELLLQQRSSKKITFPNLWTNTCCSHPEHIDSEIDTSQDYIGPRRAAIRRTAFEMNINDLELKHLHCGSRILYYADASEKFAEYELDYIIFAKTDIEAFTPNAEEVKNYEYVGMKDLDDFLDERRTKYNEDITPWFKLLKDRKL